MPKTGYYKSRPAMKTGTLKRRRRARPTAVRRPATRRGRR